MGLGSRYAARRLDAPGFGLKSLNSTCVQNNLSNPSASR
jgi:hypothetical protein